MLRQLIMECYDIVDSNDILKNIHSNIGNIYSVNYGSDIYLISDHYVILKYSRTISNDVFLNKQFAHLIEQDDSIELFKLYFKYQYNLDLIHKKWFLVPDSIMVLSVMDSF